MHKHTHTEMHEQSQIITTTKEQTNKHTWKCRHTLAYLHVVQWLYFRVVKEVDVNESYPVVWFSGIDLTSFNAPLPHLGFRLLNASSYLRSLSFYTEWSSHGQPLYCIRLGVALSLHAWETLDFEKQNIVLYCHVLDIIIIFYHWPALLCQG